jgi:hypothetical protein
MGFTHMTAIQVNFKSIKISSVNLSLWY